LQVCSFPFYGFLTPGPSSGPQEKVEQRRGKPQQKQHPIIV